MITSDKALLEESVGRSGARLSASELVRTMHAQPADSLAQDASRGFERGIRAVVELARQSEGFEQDHQRHAAPALVQQQGVKHEARHEHAAPAHRIERGHGLGIGW